MSRPAVILRALVVALVLAPIAVIATACESEPLTEIMVVSDTDLAVPSELDAIRIQVHGDPDRTEEAIARIGDGAPRPVTLGLVSSSGQGVLDVVVIGELAGAEVLRRTARVTFQRGRVLALRMDLLRSCVASSCADGETCGESGCRGIDVAPSELTEWTEPGGLDAGPQDGGPDAGPIDAGAPDANVDSGPPPSCTGAAECDDAIDCTTDTCDGGSCVHTPVASACDDAVACTVATCDPVAGCMQTPDDAMCDDGIACTVESCDALAGCRSTPVHSTCASGEYCDTTTGCTVAPTFTEIYSSIITARCGPCHTTAGTPGGGLGMATQTQAYLAMVGVTAICGGGTNVRVIPGDSSRSLLWRKVSGVDLCGDLMPRMGMPLGAASIAMIARWIDAGALDN